jgi:hypothetical protein
MNIELDLALGIGRRHCEAAGTLFQPTENCRFAPSESSLLPGDTQPYRTAAKALRHPRRQLKSRVHGR